MHLGIYNTHTHLFVLEPPMIHFPPNH